MSGSFFIPFVCVDCEQRIEPEPHWSRRRVNAPICGDCVEGETLLATGLSGFRGTGGWNIPGTTKGDKFHLRRLAALINAITYENDRDRYAW